MEPALSPKDADRDKAAPPAADELAHADDALTKLVREAGRPDAGPRAAGSDFSAEPRIAPSTLDVAPRALGDGEPGAGGRRPVVRFLLAVGIGVAATLAWQSYGDAARQMIATFVPALARPSAPGAPPPAAPVQAAATGVAPAQDAAAMQAGAAAPSASGAAAPVAAAPVVAAPDLSQQLKAMARELAAVRHSVEQISAGQEQVARTIAKLQAAEEEIEHKLTPPARRPVARRPTPVPQQLAPGPRPLWQSIGPPPPGSSP